MKTLTLFLTSIFLLSGMLSAQQTDKELTKELKDKAIKEARKEAKSLEKVDWQAYEGALPLPMILENAWKKQMVVDDKGDPVYITADGNGVAETKSVAEMQALELAKLQLAGMIQSNISSLVSANIGNTQLSQEDAVSVTEIVQSSKNLIATELGYVNPYFKIYRMLENKRVEVQVRIFYDTKQSLEIARKVVRGEIKDKLKVNEEQLNKLMGM